MKRSFIIPPYIRLPLTQATLAGLRATEASVCNLVALRTNES